MSMHINQKAPMLQSIHWFLRYDAPKDMPQRREAGEIISAIRPPLDTRTGDILFDLDAPVFYRLAKEQAEGNHGPVALVNRLRFGTVWSYRVTCPHCGRMHMHGGGNAPVPNFGHRVADCGRGSYFLMVGARS